MKKILTTLILISGLFINQALRAEEVQDVELPIRDYDAIEVPTGTFIPVMSLQDVSTEYSSEGDSIKFITTNDLFLFDTKIIPQNSIINGYIEKINNPVVGTNGAMKIKATKIILTDNYEFPIKGYVYTSKNNLIGGGISDPVKFEKSPHYPSISKRVVIRVKPSAERKMGNHTRVPAGENLLIILTAPAYITHTLTN